MLEDKIEGVDEGRVGKDYELWRNKYASLYEEVNYIDYCEEIDVVIESTKVKKQYPLYTKLGLMATSLLFTLATLGIISRISLLEYRPKIYQPPEERKNEWIEKSKIKYNAIKRKFIGFVNDIKFYEIEENKGQKFYISYFLQRSKPFLVKKPKNEKRIFVFGGSAVMGLGIKREESFPSQLEVILQKKYNNETINVINNGYPAFGSTRILTLIKETINYNPDLLIVESFNNEVLDYKMKKILEPYLKSTKLRKIRFFFDNLNLKFLNSLIKKEDAISYKIGRGEKIKLIEEYQHNIEEIVRLAKKKNMSLILCTGANNLENMYFILLNYFQIGSEETTNFLNQIEKELGDYLDGKLSKNESWNLYNRTREYFFHTVGMVGISEFNNIMRSIAEKEEDVYICDIERIFRGVFPKGALKKRLFVTGDAMHYSAEGCEIIAKELARIIVENNLLTIKNKK